MTITTQLVSSYYAYMKIIKMFFGFFLIAGSDISFAVFHQVLPLCEGKTGTSSLVRPI